MSFYYKGVTLVETALELVDCREAVERNGYALIAAVFSGPEIRALIEALEAIGDSSGVRTRNGLYAVRNLLDASDAIRALAGSLRLRSIVEVSLGRGAFAVRGTLFDKTPGANWLVPWHRDLTICAAERIETPGYGPWTLKAGVCHVQPPPSVHEKTLSLRIHLDDCDEDNGALRVLPGAHRLGRFTAEQIAQQQNAIAPVCCAAKAGDVLLMKPLLLHASSASAHARHRRVIHIDYANAPLDGKLRWQTTVYCRRD